MLPVLDGHLTAPAGAEDRGGALWAPWVSSLATAPALSKGLLTGGGAVPRTRPRSARATRCSSADRHNPPVPTCILSVPSHQTLAARLTPSTPPRPKKKKERKKVSSSRTLWPQLPSCLSLGCQQGMMSTTNVVSHVKQRFELPNKTTTLIQPGRQRRHVVDGDLKCKSLPKFAFFFSNEEALPRLRALPPCSWIIQFNLTYGCLQI